MKLKVFVNLLTAGSTVGFPLSCIGVLYWKTDFFKQENGGGKKDINAQDALMESSQKTKTEDSQELSPPVIPDPNTQQNSLPSRQNTPSDANPTTTNIEPKISLPLTSTTTDGNVSPSVSVSNANASEDNSPPPKTEKSKMTPENLSKWIQTVINKVDRKRKNLSTQNPKNDAEIQKCTKTIATLKELKKLVESISVDIQKTTEVLQSIDSTN